MNYRFFLVSACLSLPSTYTGESSKHDSSQTVIAFAGENVVLPCSFNINADEDVPTVEWSKEGLQPNVVFLYRDGCETHEMKHPSYQYRTSFIHNQLKNGNISLRISNVQVSDAGIYQCLKLPPNAPRSISIVELIVVTEPKLTVVSKESEGLIIVCEAVCWLPEPEITFLDEKGNQISANEPKKLQEASGCYSVTRTAILQDASSRVTCSIHQRKTNQTRLAHILLQVSSMRSQSLIFAITEGLTLLVLACTFIILLWKRCNKPGETNPLSYRAGSMCESGSSLRLMTNMPDSLENNIERVTIEVADLNSERREIMKTICASLLIPTSVCSVLLSSHGAACLRVTPDQSQFFRYDSISLRCDSELNTTHWKIKRNTTEGGVRSCSFGWGFASDSTCQIGKTYPTDTGMYWCQSGDGKTSNVVNITITDGDVILQSPVLPVPTGSAVVLRCKNETQSSDQKFNFYKDGRSISSSSTGKMTIHSVSKSDEGLYMCSISGGGQSASSWLFVEASPTVSRWCSFPRLLYHLVVGAPYLLSTILLGLIYRDRKRAAQNAVDRRHINGVVMEKVI
ncbi:erythroid membrane-associated protein-like [Antennarius striatus]|uniref:erythroid membrane-associated protein-like n=1 Tax=Antennarius striatus TaxID=241820 RepID=UPI0035AEDD51